MPRIEGTTDAQSKFLRAFRLSPTGPAKDDWPSPAIMRRWLQSRSFVKALDAVRKVMRYTADFQLVSAAASASQSLHMVVNSPFLESQTKLLKALGDLLRLAHLRQRFACIDFKPPPLRESALLANLRHAHPDSPLGEAIELMDKMLGNDKEEEAEAA